MQGKGSICGGGLPALLPPGCETEGKSGADPALLVRRGRGGSHSNQLAHERQVEGPTGSYGAQGGTADTPLLCGTAGPANPVKSLKMGETVLGSSKGSEAKTPLSSGPQEAQATERCGLEWRASQKGKGGEQLAGWGACFRLAPASSCERNAVGPIAGPIAVMGCIRWDHGVCLLTGSLSMGGCCLNLRLSSSCGDM